MKKIEFEQVSRWMHRNARELDLKLWNCLFENGEAIEVADALLAYQNEDGGFGHGLDPDNWNENSLSYAVSYAIETLDMVGFHDKNHPVIQGICKYLNETGMDNWNFTVPTNEGYPHASFYNHEETYNKVERIGVVLSLSTFVIRYMQDTLLYQEVQKSLESWISLIYQDKLGDMGPSGYIRLVEAMKEKEIKGFDYEKLQNRLIEIVNQTMQKDEKQWEQYGYRPSDFIKSKDSIFIEGNMEAIEKECEYLIRTLPKNDVWPVSWCWFDNANRYPREETISLHKAKARKCIERMIFLREFGFLR